MTRRHCWPTGSGVLDRHRAASTVGVAVAVLGLLGGVAGCRSSGDGHRAGAPQSCLPSTASPAAGSPAAGSPPAGSPAATGAAASRLPAITLSCLDGGAKVQLAALGHPAVINLWASWCTPCRAELPAIQSFAASGVVTVIGVDTADTTGAAHSTITDNGLAYPMLADPNKSLANAVGRSVLPITLFVDAQGGLRYVYESATPLTPQTLSQLAAEHLGVGG